jgi:citrate lyase subunit beta/citryl-CoA lyase
VEKACATATDAVIIDLEDAVPSAEKARARKAVSKLLADLGSDRLLVRVNGINTDYFQADIDQIVCNGLAALIVPKVESADDVQAINTALVKVETAKGLKPGFVPLIALIESAKAVDDISLITRAATQPARLYTVALGAADLSSDLGIEITGDGAELQYPRSRLPIACRAAGLEPPLDTPFMRDLKSMSGLQADALRAKQLGFQGKLCIHPNQIDIVNRIFSPQPEEIKMAHKVIAAFEKAETAGQGALQVDGKFVDYPVVARARRILQIASTLGDAVG